MLPDREPPRCPACGHPATGSRLSLYDDRYGATGRYRVQGCLRCGHHFLLDPPAVETLAALYARHYPRRRLVGGTLEPRRRRRPGADWLAGVHAGAWYHVPPAVRVLDIGCGFGESLRYHQRRGCAVWGVEVDPTVAAAVAPFGDRVHVGPFRASVFGTLRFDYITLDQVLEHLVDPVRSLTELRGLLRPGGRIVVSTPNSAGWGRRSLGPRWIHWHLPYHCQHFGPDSLAASARRAGLRCISLGWATRSDWWLYQWCHLITRPAPQRASLFWALRSDKPLALKIALLLVRLATHASGFNHLLARIGDACRAGDNLVAVLERAPDAGDVP